MQIYGLLLYMAHVLYTQSNNDEYDQQESLKTKKILLAD